MNDSKIVIIGSNGQLGTALREKYPNAQALGSAQLDITDRQAVEAFDWSNADVIINAAAYTDVDGAETPEGRIAAWKVNAEGPANLVRTIEDTNITLVHISTDYIFDGTTDNHTEDETPSPLSTYGASKAGGDIAVSQHDNHYILRTSWVIGKGKNFVNTMLNLAAKGTNPTVVADQTGRLTFTDELVRAIDHLLVTDAPFGTYNVTNSGKTTSWADIARETFKIAGLANTVTDTTTAEYFDGKEGVAPRPLQSALSLDKLQATGFTSTDWQAALKDYLKSI